MKYIVILCDGMSDYPMTELGDKTPMGYADKPNMNMLAGVSKLGLVKTVQDNLKPGSDVANLSILGYNPAIYHSGRSPLEAASIGIDMKTTDVSLRCNLVTLSDEENYNDKTMIDYCADDISTAEAKQLIEFIQSNYGSDMFKYYCGVSYRHCLIWSNGTTDVGTLTPPHDIIGRCIGSYISDSVNTIPLIEMMKKSYDLLKEHPINRERIKNGRRPANSIWLWGEGKKKELTPFKEKYNLTGAVISAVDLIKGIGRLTCMEVIEVPGATGYLDTNFTGKAKAAINSLKTNDFVYIHIEAPDECGHRGEVEGKIKSLELIDKLILGPILSELNGQDFKLLICPDHATPLSLKTHTNDPVPFLIYDSRKKFSGNEQFSEEACGCADYYIEEGHELLNVFLGKDSEQK